MARTFQNTPADNVIAWPRALAITAVVALLFWFVRDTLLLVFAGALLGLALRASAQQLHAAVKLPLVVSVWLVVFIVVVLIALFVAFAGGALASQWMQFAATFERALRVALSSFDLTWVTGNAVALFERARGIVSGALGALVATLVIIFVAVAGALEPALYRDGFLAVLPPAKRPKIALLLDDVGRTLRTWLLARSISMCITGTLVWIGLSILRVPLAPTLGLLAGALAFVPNIGAFVAGAPAVVIALSIDVRLAAATVVMYWLVHFIDDFLFSPYIERRMVRLPPILTLIAQLSLAVSAGTLGLMLAAPLVAVILVTVQRLWIEDPERNS